MKDKINSIIARIKSVNEGEPWFGRAAFELLDEVKGPMVYNKPNQETHSLIELLYHMITWADFTLKRLEKNKEIDLAAAEKLDWRTIDPAVHTWEEGLKEFKQLQQAILANLSSKDDRFLEEKVDYRNYNFEFLLQGIVDHTIYHVGQIAYIWKTFKEA